MKKITMSFVAMATIMGSFSSISAADGVNILDDIKVKGEIRPRFEMVSSVGNKTTAKAYTARTKLNATSKLLGVDGLTTSVGVISVNNFGAHQYNTPATNYTDGTRQYSIVKDPQAAMLSNAEVNYVTGKTLIHAGRGQVNLDNQRFIGTVGWRQLERSYDSVFVANNSIKNLSVLAAWVYGYAGVGSTQTVDTNTLLLHATYNVMPELKVTAYDYMIANLHDTLGVALTGTVDMGAKLSYRAEFATQGDATMEKGVQTSTTGKASATYYNLDLGANVSGLLAGINYEYFSGQSWTGGSETNFSTPLATGHKFNGWADVASSANGGLIDLNIRLGYKAKGLGKVLAVYHTFTADTKAAGASDDKGSELDIVYANKVPGFNGLTGLVKFANFSKGKVAETTNDVKKLWAMLDYKFSTK